MASKQSNVDQRAGGVARAKAKARALARKKAAPPQSKASAARKKNAPQRVQVPAGLAKSAQAIAHVTVGARQRAWQLAHGTSTLVAGKGGSLRLVAARKKPGGGGRAARIPATVCEALAAAANEHRVKILMRLVIGSASYDALKKATALAPGPLYHHVNQLRMAGLIGPKQRDTYELTDIGRNLILILAAAAPLLKQGG